MRDEQNELSIQDTLKKLVLFFPDEASTFTLQSVEAGLNEGNLLAQSNDILPYVQTAFFDDKLLEIELNGIPRVYLSRMHDHTPDLVEVEEDGDIVLQEPEYKSGNYLNEMTHLISLPLEPGMGNLHIRNSQKVLLRFFTSTGAIELGTFCEEMSLVRELPVLQLSYPVIGRLLPKTRVYRAKVPATMGLQLVISGQDGMADMHYNVTEVSVNGMSFLIQKKEQQLFRTGESRVLQFILDDLLHTGITGIIRHVSRIRGKAGTEYRCGVQFELTTRALAAKVETLVATIQRAHLQELSKKSEEFGVTLIR